jgi:hypothetical protein
MTRDNCSTKRFYKHGKLDRQFLKQLDVGDKNLALQNLQA